MGEPQRSDAVEHDRRSAPRFPADVLGKASVRLLGGSEVTLINFSERGILFQSETRLLVGARGTVRITVGSDTTIAAGTVVRSLVQGMASGKLAFHTALHLDQPLALAKTVAERERAKAAPPAPAEAPVEDAVQAPPPPVAAPPPPSGKTIEKRSHKGAKEKDKEKRNAEHDDADAAAAPAEPPAPVVPAPPPAPEPDVAVPAAAPPVAAPPAPAFDSGFGGSGFDGGSFGWSDPAADTQAAGLSVLFVSTTKERTARLQGLLANHRRDIALTTLVHSRSDALDETARQHDVLLFDFAIGPETLERTLLALRGSPLGASIAIFVPQQTALPTAVSSLANACVIDSASGEMLVAALRDAAWTPWQPMETAGGSLTPREDLFWKAFDALPVPVLVVNAAGTIVHANDACAKVAEDVVLDGAEIASLFAAADAPAIAHLIAEGLEGRHDESTYTTPADGRPLQVVLQALSVLPGVNGSWELAIRCELRAEARVEAPPAPAGPDLAAQVAELSAERERLVAAHAALEQALDAARREAGTAGQELEDVRQQVQASRRERDEARAQLEIAQRDLDRARELERAGAARIAELERMVGDAARMEVTLARAQTDQAATTEELQRLRAELDGLRMRATSQGADAERSAARYAAIEAGARQAVDELKAARAEAQKLTRERDQAVAAAEAARTRADAAVAAARDDGKKGRKLVTDEAAVPLGKLQRQLEELRAELKQEQDARKELEELLDQNAANLEQTIQDYEERLEALGAGVEDKRPSKPKKSRQG